MPSPSPAQPDPSRAAPARDPGRARSSPARPEPHELGEFYRDYVTLVPEGDVLATLARAITETRQLFDSFGESRGDYRYASGKWSVKELAGHLADGERILGYRTLRIARGDSTPLPGFEQDDYVARGRFERRTLADLCDELALLRAANLALFRTLDAEEWARTGTANGYPFVARAVPWIIAGHELHHCRVLRERYV
jgi:hypothetical protein